MSPVFTSILAMRAQVVPAYDVNVCVLLVPPSPVACSSNVLVCQYEHPHLIMVEILPQVLRPEKNVAHGLMAHPLDPPAIWSWCRYQRGLFSAFVEYVRGNINILSLIVPVVGEICRPSPALRLQRKHC